MKETKDGSRRKRADNLFGQIATRLNIITQDQLQEALLVQQNTDQEKPLGLILMDLKYVSQEDLQKILEAQKAVAGEATKRAKVLREDNLFGKVAIRLHFASEDQVHECLTMQEQLSSDRFMRLGDIMVIKGYLSVDQVNRIIDLQKGLIVYCQSCDTQYNVVMFRPGSSLCCYHCGAALRIPIRKTSSKMDEAIYFGDED